MSAFTPVRAFPSPSGEVSDSVPPTFHDAPLLALALCWHCSVAAHRIDPPGWVTVNPSREMDVVTTSGICPECLAARYSFPWSFVSE